LASIEIVAQEFEGKELKKGDSRLSSFSIPSWPFNGAIIGDSLGSADTSPWTDTH